MNSYANYGGAYAGASSRKKERAYNTDRVYNTTGGSNAAYGQSPYGYYPPNGYYGYGYMGPPVVPPPRSASYDYAYAGQVPRHRRTSDPGAKPQGRPVPVYKESKGGKAGREKDEEEEFRKARRGRTTVGNVGNGAANILQAIPPQVPLSTPNFIFVSLSSHDVLKVGNLASVGESEDVIRARLKKAWSGGFTEERTEERGFIWSLTLGGDVWSASGTFGIKARRYICKLFQIFAAEGIQYLTTTGNNPFKTPRMIFTSGHEPDPDPDYFMISFSSNQRTLLVIDAPYELAETIGTVVGINHKPLPPRPGEAFSRDTTRTNEWIDKHIYQVPTSPDFNQDISVMMAVPLRLIAAEGWRLEASVPLGRCGIFGHKGRREIWMFHRTLTPEEERYAGFHSGYIDEFY